MPVPEVESITNIGLVRFEFDRPMDIPDGYKEWRGNNSYLNGTEFGVWKVDISIPIDI